MRISHTQLVGQKIKKLRVELNLTQLQLAAAAGISPVYIGYIENGRRHASLAVLERIARNLKAPLRNLL